MHEAEPRGVQAEPPELPGGTAVLSIADNGMPDSGQLDTDLAAPSGAEAQLETRRVLTAREHTVARDGRPAFRAACRVDAEAPLHGACLELGLEALLGFGRLGEDEQPRGLAVEPMHDEGARARPLRAEVVP